MVSTTPKFDLYEQGRARRLSTKTPRLPRVRLALACVLGVAVVAAAVSLVLRFGFDPPLISSRVFEIVEYIAIAAFAAERVARLFPLSVARRQLARHRLDFLLIALAIGFFVVRVETDGRSPRPLSIALLLVLQGLVLVRLATDVYQYRLRRQIAPEQPAKMLVGSFLAVILVGGLLLSLPTASRPILAGEKGYQWRGHVINCLFTSTSAVCVTGLTVYDTGQDFTFGGQVIIVILIQIGGLGIMLVGTVFGLLLNRQMSLRESVVMQDVLSHDTLGQISRAAKFVCIATFLIEAAGAATLYPMWSDADVQHGGRLFWSIFHSVSAFCNAGFALPSGNMLPYRLAWQTYGVFMPLIVLGGIGFPVLSEVYDSLRRWGLWAIRHTVARWRGWTLPLRPKRRPYSLHTRLALLTTGGLIVGGALLIWITETPAPWTRYHRVRMDGKVEVQPAKDCMAAMPAGERALSALFLSVTSRTAGFNTVRMDEDALSPATHYLVALLMFIGGSPASTAGGIKTVTLIVLLAAIRSTLRGRQETEVFRRSVSLGIVRRAAVIFMLMAAMVFTSTFLLCYVENRTLRSLLFETISASGTVGLSTGVTPSLTRFGKFVIMLTMFAGRVGPLTLLVALSGRLRPARYDYPEEQPIIG